MTIQRTQVSEDTYHNVKESELPQLLRQIRAFGGEVIEIVQTGTANGEAVYRVVARYSNTTPASSMMEGLDIA